jgi:hypothetical protein
MPQTARAAPNALPMRSPFGKSCSAQPIAVRTSIHGRLMTPTAKTVAINAQQQPTHTRPCSKPTWNARGGPLRQHRRKWVSGLRQWRRHACFSGVNCVRGVLRTRVMLIWNDPLSSPVSMEVKSL